jgi:Delta7-sterol 5-desaturase
MARIARIMTTLMYVGAAIAGGLVMYWGISGVFELVYYRGRRERAAEWKCQPRRWLSPKMLRQQLVLGTANVVMASILSGFFASYLAGGGASAVYFDTRAHGLLFTVLTTVVYFLLTDAGLYWAHRILHRPLLFRTIHRFHHRYISPTAFTAMAMHPVELLTYQSVMLIPLFVLPVHVVGLIAVLVYQNYVAMVDHSGIDLHSWLPWQPATRFHDDHHVYFHVNYGQNMGFWDWLFGTYRREGRVYGVEVFGGRGAPAPGAAAGPARYVDYRRKPARAEGAGAAAVSTAVPADPAS